MNLRIGHGFDVHRFGEGDFVVLGGVKIPHDHGLVAHSDGDVAIHALCDALLGAAGLGDIGRHFPDTDDQFKGIDSRELLRQVIQQLAERKMKPSNIDLTIIAQAPRLSTHIEQMCATLADDLQLAVEDVNVKATTTEKLGYTGRKEGIAAHAVVLVQKD
ncbi:2-C-methyl-D-erythritol 2,4-cyclodiphosphate synthase [Endozoicomonadaceae bacterium StTr2]